MGQTADIRVALVGFGQRSAIGRHVPKAHEGAVVTAVVDTHPAGRQRARSSYPAAQVHSEVGELIAAGVADAAVVTTPDHTHEAVTLPLIEAGIAVYLEKPLAITVQSTDRILTAAAEHDTPLYIGHNMRHSGLVQTMRQVIESGAIGEVKTVWVRHFVGNGGDYYFKDWHADRSKTNTLLLQKACHDIDVIHCLAEGYSRRVVGMGDLMVYGGITDRRDRTGELMADWFSFENWPPASQTGLNPVVDVEDVSMMMMTLDNGVMASYQQCHFTPDYWRNYTVIGTEGRLENIGDTAGGQVKVWNRRRHWDEAGDVEHPIEGVTSGHADADLRTMREFLGHIAEGTPTVITPIAARAAVAAGALAADSLRAGSVPLDIPELPEHVVAHFQSTSAVPTAH